MSSGLRLNLRIGRAKPRIITKRSAQPDPQARAGLPPALLGLITSLCRLGLHPLRRSVGIPRRRRTAPRTTRRMPMAGTTVIVIEAVDVQTVFIRNGLQRSRSKDPRHRLGDRPECGSRQYVELFSDTLRRITVGDIVRLSPEVPDRPVEGIQHTGTRNRNSRRVKSGAERSLQ